MCWRVVASQYLVVYSCLQFGCLGCPVVVTATDLPSKIPEHVDELEVAFSNLLLQLLQRGWVLFEKFIVLKEVLAVLVVLMTL